MLQSQLCIVLLTYLREYKPTNWLQRLLKSWLIVEIEKECEKHKAYQPQNIKENKL